MEIIKIAPDLSPALPKGTGPGSGRLFTEYSTADSRLMISENGELVKRL